MILADVVQPDWAEGFPAAGERKAATWVTTDPDEGVHHAPFLTYAVREAASGLLIGGAGFHGRPVNRSIELGYGLSPAYWGRGLATEACRALLQAAFDRATGRQHLAAKPPTGDNERSRRVLRRAGFIAQNATETYWVATRP